METHWHHAPDGARLRVLRWNPPAAPRARVVLMHGHGEHAMRHADGMSLLAEAGFVVTGWDQRGHGRSAGRRGWVDSYDQLLDVFWTIHDPTQRNRQGLDVGSQYRSAIFAHTPEQEAAARASKAALDESGRLTRPIVTEVQPAPAFYLAEDYHQRYEEKHRGRLFGRF